MVHDPKVGTKTMDIIISLASAAFAADMGVQAEDLVNIGKISPSARTLKEMVYELACDSVLINSINIKERDLALVYDKGGDKKNVAAFVKFLCFCNGESVEVVCFSIEGTGNASINAATGINHSLKLFESIDGIEDSKYLVSIGVLEQLKI